MLLLHKLLIPLVLTIGIEFLVLVMIKKESDSRLFFGIIAVNMATNPMLNFIIYIINYYMPITQTSLLMLAFEILIIIIEWILLNYMTKEKSAKTFVYSFVMNLVSYLFGVILF